MSAKHWLLHQIQICFQNPTEKRQQTKQSNTTKLKVACGRSIARKVALEISADCTLNDFAITTDWRNCNQSALHLDKINECVGGRRGNCFRVNTISQSSVQQTIPRIYYKAVELHCFFVNALSICTSTNRFGIILG